MKTKYLFLAVAALGMAACAEVDDFSQNYAPAGGGVEKGYLAVDLNADGATRAAGDSYEDGTVAEQAVSRAAFFFFDAAGNPFNINADGNYFNVAVADNGSAAAPNIESMTNPVLVVEKYKGEFPASVVAIVNYTATASFPLANLRNQVISEGHTSGADFVMTNSVYADGAGNAVYATPLTIDNFQTSEAAALENPVTIHVERVVAKMNVTAGATAFDTGVKVNDKSVFASRIGRRVRSRQSSMTKRTASTG